MYSVREKWKSLQYKESIVLTLVESILVGLLKGWIEGLTWNGFAIGFATVGSCIVDDVAAELDFWAAC